MSRLLRYSSISELQMLKKKTIADFNIFIKTNYNYPCIHLRIFEKAKNIVCLNLIKIKDTPKFQLAINNLQNARYF